MKFLLVGGGAREHAMAEALVAAPDTEVVSVLKHRNPGIVKLSRDVLLGDETSPGPIVEFARKHAVDCVVVGPEAPLAAGVTDALRRANFHVAAPSKAAAEIETSKRFMRELLTKHKVPGNVRALAFDSADAAKAFLRKEGVEFALKPIGLTGGKGVRVFGDHFRDLAGASAYVDEVFAQKIGGAGILVEELLRGEEFTVQCFADGRRVVPTIAVQDHKRLLPGDEGPNTGGMGSYSQADGLLPFLPKRAFEDAVAIVKKIVEALAAEGRPYVGPIYGQFMLTKQGPRVVEVNARFGDPEAMNVFRLLETPYADIAQRMAEQRLSSLVPRFRSLASVVKYVVPQGYGSQPEAGVEVRVDGPKLRESHAQLYLANVEEKTSGRYVCGTSRALAIVGAGETLHEANAQCEEGLAAVRGDRIHVRHDIGTKDLIERRIVHMRSVLGS